MPPSHKRTWSITAVSGSPAHESSAKRSRTHRSGSIGSAHKDVTDAILNKLQEILKLSREVDYMIMYDQLPPPGKMFDEPEASSNQAEGISQAEPPMVKEVQKQPSLYDQFATHLPAIQENEKPLNQIRTLFQEITESDMDADSYTEMEGQSDEEADDEPEVDDPESPQVLISTTTRLRDTVKALVAQRNNRGDNVQIISFSSFTEKHYARVGIDPRYSTVNAQPVFKKLLKDYLASYDTKVTENVTEELGNLMRRVGAKRYNRFNKFSEMSSRGVIDEFFDCLVFGHIFKKTVLVTKRGKGDIFVMPEFVLVRRPQKLSTPEVDDMTIPIVKDGQVTFLSGSTDYFSVVLDSETAAQLDNDVQVRTRATMAEWNALLVGMAEGLQGCFAILEAKWPGATLVSHIPQVVAEALGLHLRTRSNSIPFCLTNSVEWIFGVLAVQNSSAEIGVDVKAKISITQCIRLETPADVLFIFLALHYWASDFASFQIVDTHEVPDSAQPAALVFAP